MCEHSSKICSKDALEQLPKHKKDAGNLPWKLKCMCLEMFDVFRSFEANRMGYELVGYVKGHWLGVSHEVWRHLPCQTRVVSDTDSLL